MVYEGFFTKGLFPIWTVILGFYIGAVCGSFLNMLIWRLPRSISLFNPRHSICPNCKTVLGFSELIPLFSWLFQGGRCKTCGLKIKSRYFWVEMITGFMWATAWWKTMVVAEDVPRFFFLAAVASTLVVVFFIDFELFIIPDQVNAFLFFLGLLYNFFLYLKKRPEAFLYGYPSSLVGAFVGVAILWGIAFLGRVAFGKDAMGHGDIKLARGIGAVLLPALAIWSFSLAVVMGAVFGIIQTTMLPRKQTAFEGEVDSKEPTAAEMVAEEEAGIAEYQPESIGSLLFCGLGYFLCIDIIGLFIPRLYIKWFGEDPYAPISEMDDFEVEPTMIPFGPYMALGALLAVVFQDQLFGLWDSYMRAMRPSSASILEHLLR